MPMTRGHARAAGTRKLHVDGASAATLAKAAGNAMSLPCVGAFILAAIMGIESRSVGP